MAAAAHALAQQQLGEVRPSCWELYFPELEWEPADRRASLLSSLLPVLEGQQGWRLLREGAYQWHSRTVVELDWQELRTVAASTELAEALDFAPSEALASLAGAVHEVLFERQAERTRAELAGHIQDDGRVSVRLRNRPELTLPSAVRADLIGRLITVRGTVVRCTPVRPLVTTMHFVCGKCGDAFECPFPDGKYSPPVACGTHGCRGRHFHPTRATAACVDWQRISVQGLPRDERAGQGRVPTPIDVELTEDLVGSCSPGDVVTVVGFVKVINGETSSGKVGSLKQQCIFVPFIDAISVVVSGKEQVSGRQRHRQAMQAAAAVEGGGEDEEEQGVSSSSLSFLPPSMQSFSQNDLAFICQFTQLCEGDQLRTLVHSLCPTIMGQDLVKAGLLLALFGGVRKHGSGGRGSVPVRGDIHCLMVGDPGLGKSQLLQAAAGAAPRGVYICGNTSSAAGLTVSVVREGGEFAFDAGALVLADRGVCAIDEFDKCTAEHQALLGAMEQQEVSVAKAGLVASLPARTTVLAAANPVDGSYNRGKGLLENLKMSPAMLSRFDLLFLLVDRPDAQRDQRLSEHIMAIHSGVPSRAAAARSRMLLTRGAATGGSSLGGNPLLLTDGRESVCGGQPSLLERLQQRKPDDDPVPQPLLRKYIAYARQYCHPRLSLEAKSVLKGYYLLLRQQAAADPCGLPVTARQLESLIRLTEARARVDLREEASRQDAEDVVEIMRHTLDGMAAEGPCHIDFRGSGGGRAGSLAAERSRFLEALKRCVLQRGTDDIVSVAEMYAVADQIELAVEDVPAFFDKLNEAGDILKKGNERYQLYGCRKLLESASTERSSQGGGYDTVSGGSKRSFAQSYGGL